MKYKLSNEAKLDFAHIYWRGVENFGEPQAERYYTALVGRFEDIAEAPYKYQTVEHIRKGYRRSVCGVDSIYFRVSSDAVEIMRVLGRQDVVESI